MTTKRTRKSTVYDIEGQKLTVAEIYEKARQIEPKVSLALIQKRIYVDGNRRWDNLVKPPVSLAGRKDKWTKSNAGLFKKKEPMTHG